MQTLGHATSGTFPAGGPANASSAGGGMSGGNTGASEALAYIEANGGGTLYVSSQNGAAGYALQSGADVAALGGFSGRESEVSIEWLAQRVADGTIRWVMTDGEGGGMMNDGRTGSHSIMAAIEEAGTPVSGVEGLYDLAGSAEALAALA